MIPLTISITNLDALRANFGKAPSLALKYLAKATTASIFEVEKQAVDRNFQFKTPRALRTGRLALSFAQGRVIAPGGLRAAIGPTARHRGFYYPAAVYFGTTRGLRANPFMDRIARAAEPDVNQHFEKAVDLLVSDIARV
jgi:hypothetical protein